MPPRIPTSSAVGRWPRRFQALADPTRLRILALLHRRPDLCVSEVAQALGLTVPAASQQFKVLERAGFVRKIREGQKICHELCRDDLTVRALLKLILPPRKLRLV